MLSSANVCGVVHILAYERTIIDIYNTRGVLYIRLSHLIKEIIALFVQDAGIARELMSC